MEERDATATGARGREHGALRDVPMEERDATATGARGRGHGALRDVPMTERDATATGARVRIRIDLAYDGAPFSGFARQPDRATVQGTLEGALSRVLGHTVDTTCAGRTDAGVHALAQVVHLDVDGSGTRAARWLQLVRAHPDSARRRLDRLVGDAIALWDITEVAATFDARFSATERRYRYRLVDAEVGDPRVRGVRWTVGESLAAEAMHAAVQHVVGEHDFASLCRRAPGRSTRRRVDEAAVSRVDDEIHVLLRGPAFCHQQVRATVGCLVEVGAGRRPPEWMGQVVAAGDRAVAARVAPPHGLTLEGVAYGGEWPPAPPAVADLTTRQVTG